MLVSVGAKPGYSGGSKEMVCAWCLFLVVVEAVVLVSTTLVVKTVVLIPVAVVDNKVVFVL